jgi:hemerythrin
MNTVEWSESLLLDFPPMDEVHHTFVDLLALARAGNMAAVREMAGELAVWFAKHTQTLDAALALHMRSVQSDLPVRRTHRTSAHPASAP